MNPQIDKVVRVTTVVATAVASYFLLTADYGPEPNALDPVSSLIASFKFLKSSSLVSLCIHTHLCCG